MAAARYQWIFRPAAVLYLLFGPSWIWRYGFTDYDPRHRPFGVAIGVIAVIVGVFLLRRARFAIALSALGAALLAIAAAFAAPLMRGPGILACALLALVFGLYAVLAARVLLERGPQTPGP